MKTEQIAADYRLWEEYVDPSGLMSREDFDAMTFEERVQFCTDCFGIEYPEEEQP